MVGIRVTGLDENARICLDEGFRAFLRDDPLGMEKCLRNIVMALPVARSTKTKVATDATMYDILQIFEYAKDRIKGILAYSDWLRLAEFCVLLGWLYEIVPIVAFDGAMHPNNKKSYFKWAGLAYIDAIDAIDQFLGGLPANWEMAGKIISRLHTVRESYKAIQIVRSVE